MTVEIIVGIVLLLYLGLFVWKYLNPLLSFLRGPSFETDLARLENGVEKSLGEAEERLEYGPNAHETVEVQYVAYEAAMVESGADDQEEPLGYMEDSRGVERPEEWDDEADGVVQQEDDWEEVKEAGPTPRPDAREATLALRNAAPLQASYNDRWVQETVTQLRLRFPDGDYHAFDLTLLPSFNEFKERAVAARNAASLFVLFGLLGTMLKLDDVVGEIGLLASSGGVTPEAFIEGFGALLSDIGGAFMASIIGLVLTIGFLIFVSLVTSRVEQRVQRVETVAVQKVVPRLRDLHDLYFPPLTLPDLLERTGAQLVALDGTVQSMNAGMGTSLSSLETQIKGMLVQFGTFQNQYVQLNDLVKGLRATGDSVLTASKKLGAATDKLRNPIDRFNEELNTTLREHIAVVREVQLTNDEELAAVRARMEELQAQNVELMQGIHEILTEEYSARKESDATVAEQIAALVRAVEGTNNAKLAHVAKNLGESTDRLQKGVQTASSSLEKTAAVLARAADELGGHAGPPTLFAWVRMWGRRARQRWFSA